MTQVQINGPALLRELLMAEDLRLRSAPPTLAIRLPQFLLRVLMGEFDPSEERQWIQLEDADSYRP